MIGQFGIGFLSGFVVAQNIIVHTKSWQAADNPQGWCWENAGRKEYSLSAADVDKVGTEVLIEMDGPVDHGLIRDDAIREVVRTYADMLKIPIYLNHSETSIHQPTSHALGT